MKKHSRYNAARKALIAWCLFIGVGAVAGSLGMLVDVSGKFMGMDVLLPYFQILPFAEYLFQDYFFSGIALLCVNGITNLTAAALMFKRKISGAICGAIFGVTLMAWIVIQLVIFPPNIIDTLYFAFGLAQTATGVAALIFYRQERFSVDMSDYPNIGRDKTRLVVYFSRMGYTKALACAAAEKAGAELYEIVSTEPTAGTPGFWWCGRFGMHRWDMSIKSDLPDLSTYSHVTICTPIWAFHISAPVRAFCRSARGRISEADYIISHFQRCAYRNAAGEMDSLLGITATGAESVCCRMGRVVGRNRIDRG